MNNKLFVVSQHKEKPDEANIEIYRITGEKEKVIKFNHLIYQIVVYQGMLHGLTLRELVKIDLNTGKVKGRIDLSGERIALSESLNSLYVVSPNERAVYKINASNYNIHRKMKIGHEPYEIFTVK